MRKVTSFLRFSAGFGVIVIVSLLVFGFALLLLPFRVTRIKLCNLYGKIVGRSITFIVGVKPLIHDRARIDGSMPAIYVSNHTSTLDMFLSVWLCPYGGCGVFKKEIVRVPFFGWIAWLSGHLLIDRNNHEKALESLRSTAEYVKKNRLGIWIFPEGTRSRDGSLLPFKKGFVHMAIATGFPVVPVVVHGANRNWVAGTFQFNPMTLDVDVLPPIDTTGWTEANAGAHADEVRQVFETVLKQRA